MINPHNVIDILTNLISTRLTLNGIQENTGRDEDVAELLFDNVSSIFSSTSYSYENDDTLDFDGDDRQALEEIRTENENSNNDDNEDDDDNDEDYEFVYEKSESFQTQFSM